MLSLTISKVMGKMVEIVFMFTVVAFFYQSDFIFRFILISFIK
jgi:hypothetical protein